MKTAVQVHRSVRHACDVTRSIASALISVLLRLSSLRGSGCLRLTGHLASAEPLETGLKRIPAPGPGRERRHARDHARPDRKPGHDFIDFFRGVGPDDKGEADAAAERAARENAVFSREL